MKLYEYPEMLAMVEELEDTEEKTIHLNNIQMDFEDKVFEIGKYIADLKANIETLKSEEKRLCDKRKLTEKNIEFLTGYIKENMELMKTRKVETPLWKFNIVKNRPSVEVYNIDLIPKQYVSTEIVRKVDKNAIYKAIKEGEHFDGVTVKESEGLRIR